jgi:glycerol-3-phosphate cytidylyltransferase
VDTLTRIRDIQKRGGRIGFTCSSFDLLHAGHIAMLEEAKAQCEFLVVGLLDDPTADRDTKNKPVQTMFERWVQLQDSRSVDMIIPFSKESDIVDMLLMIRPDVRILGEEYRDKEFTGYLLDIPLYFNKRLHSFSSRELRQRVVHAGRS